MVEWQIYVLLVPPARIRLRAPPPSPAYFASNKSAMTAQSLVAMRRQQIDCTTRTYWNFADLFPMCICQVPFAYVCARACAYMHICGRGNMHASCVYLDMSIDTYVCEHMLAPLRTHVFANITFHSELHINALVNQQRSLLENTLKYFSVFLNCFYI